MFTDSFVNILNRDGVTLELAGSDRAAIENEPGNIQARQGHDSAGNGFVATDEHNQGIEEIASCDKLDRIGDDFAAHQRRAHTFRAHRDAIRNGDGVEFEGSSPGRANAILHMLGEFAEVIVTRADLNPGIGHTDQRLLEVIILQAASAKHGACTGTACAIGQRLASRFER